MANLGRQNLFTFQGKLVSLRASEVPLETGPPRPMELPHLSSTPLPTPEWPWRLLNGRFSEIEGGAQACPLAKP